MMSGKAPIKASLLAKMAAPKTEGGIDIGPSEIAWTTETDAGQFKFCAEVNRPHEKIKTLQREIDRQNKANNPDNFKHNGKIKSGKKIWKKSKSQIKNEMKLKELHRHEAAVRKNAHGREVNFLLGKALNWRDDGVSPKMLQKIYGKSSSVRGPGHWMSELSRKAERAGGSRTAIDVRKLKNSQYDHTTNDFVKKKLSDRWHVLRDGSGEVQRDVYSAFLALNSRGNVYEPSSLSKAWARLVPALASSGLYKKVNCNP
jgi:hypothetical protein